MTVHSNCGWWIWFPSLTWFTLSNEKFCSWFSSSMQSKVENFLCHLAMCAESSCCLWNVRRQATFLTSDNYTSNPTRGFVFFTSGGLSSSFDLFYCLSLLSTARSFSAFLPANDKQQTARREPPRPRNVAALCFGTLLSIPSAEKQRNRAKEWVTHPYPLHLQEDGSLEGLLPRGQVTGQLHPEGVALSVADQDAEAQGVVVLLLGRVLQAEVEPRLQPAVLCHPELQIKETKQQHE